MKIVLIDNYARDTVSDKVIEENIADPDVAQAKANVLNSRRGHEQWYVVRPDDYVPHVFNPEY